MDYQEDNKKEKSTLNENSSDDAVVTPKRRKQSPSSHEQTSAKTASKRNETASKNDFNRKYNSNATDKKQYTFFRTASDADSAFNIAMTYFLALLPYILPFAFSRMQAQYLAAL